MCTLLFKKHPVLKYFPVKYQRLIDHILLLIFLPMMVSLSLDLISEELFRLALI